MTENADNPTADIDGAEPVSELDALKAQLAEAQAQASTARETQLRAVADLENTRRRIERDAASSLKFATEKLLGELLAVTDSLELGLRAAETPDAQVKALADGMQLTYRQLMSVLEKYGVKQVDPTGQPFNPDHHQAMTMAEATDLPPNHVLSTMQKGYLLHERLLRPAMVIVTRGPVA